MDNMYIFGAGYFGLHFCELCISKGIIPSGIVDSSECLRGKKWGGNIEIISPNDLLDKKALIIVCLADTYECDLIIEKLRIKGHKNVVSIYEFSHREKNRDIFVNQKIILHVDLAILQKNTDKIEKVRNLLADEKSKMVYNQIIDSLYSGDFSGISSIPLKQQYFPDDLFERTNSEVFVDIGGGPGGDVMDAFIDKYGNHFWHYYLLDACDYIKKIEKKEQKFTIEHIAIGNCSKYVNVRNYLGKNALVVDEGDESVQCITLDEYMHNRCVTILKADVEGMEMDVVRGGINTIKNYRPILEFAIYHYLSEFWELPLYFDGLLEDYKFFVRSYLGVFETILYAIPKERLLRQI